VSTTEWPFAIDSSPILILGVLTSALSLAALVHLLTTTNAQRVERARDAVTEEAGAACP